MVHNPQVKRFEINTVFLISPTLLFAILSSTCFFLGFFAGTATMQRWCTSWGK